MLRWISGIIVALLVIFLLLSVSALGVQITVVCLSMVGLWEYFTLTQKGVPDSVKGIGLVVGGVATTLLVFWAREPDHFLTIFSGILVVTFLIHMKAGGDFALKIRNMVFFYFGIMYISLLFSYWGWMRDLDQWRFWVFLMLGCTFAADVGGYLAGHQFGRIKLAPLLSPGKTVEGLLGGLVFSVAAGFLVRFLFRPDFPIDQLATVCALIALVGPLGDLSESLIKRGVNAKDSGNLIPGHGGLLDRVDALLFTGPVVYYFAKYFS